MGRDRLGRLFNTEIGGQIAWLLPAALVLGAAALWFARRDRRTTWPPADAVGRLAAGHRPHLQLHGRHLPRLLHRRARPRDRRPGRHRRLGALAAPRPRSPAAVARPSPSLGPRCRAFILLDRTPTTCPGCGRWSSSPAWPRRAAASSALTAAAAPVRRRRRGGGPGHALAAPAAYAAQHRGTRRTPARSRRAGPASAGRMGMPGGGLAVARRPGWPPGRRRRPAAGCAERRRARAARRPRAGAAPGARNAGGLLNGSTPTSELTALLQADADAYTWVAAAVGSNSASGYQLATEEPVMAIGGFNGSDPSPTLAQFQAYVAAGEIHYFIAGGGWWRPAAGRPGRSAPARRSRTGWRRTSPPPRSTASPSTTCPAGAP